MTLHSMTIFFPMYNEAGNIEKVITKVENVIPMFNIPDIEILLIDDGSRDGCDQTVDDWARRNPSVRLVRHPRNMGYGVALRTGFLEAKKDAVFYTDSDLPADLMDIQRAILLLETADLVIGYRILRQETLRRALFSRIYNLLMWLMFGVRVRDVNFSFKLVHRRVLDCIHLNATTVFIDGQILAEAQRCGFKIAEIPIDYTPRKIGSSNFDSFRTAWQTFTEMFYYWRRRPHDR